MKIPMPNGKSNGSHKSFTNRHHMANGGPRVGRGGNNGAASSAGSDEPVETTNGIEPADKQQQHDLQRQKSLKQDGNNLRYPATKEFLHTHLVASEMAEANGQHNELAGRADAHMEPLTTPIGQAQPNAITPHSVPSCATDCDCLQGVCNISSDCTTSVASLDGVNNDNINNNNHHHHSHHQQQQQHNETNRKPYSDLLVETADSATRTSSMNNVAPINGQYAPIRTTLIPSGPSSPLRQDRSEEPMIWPNADIKSATSKCQLGDLEDNCDGLSGSRSACGALELYTTIGEQDRDISSRIATPKPVTVTSFFMKQHVPKQQKPLACSAFAASVQEFSRDTNSMIVGNEFKRAVSTSMSHSFPKNCDNGDNDASALYDGSGNIIGTVSDELAVTGDRSVGSATFAPFQIVKFQATQRQLSQNETTTRLLIAVMILFLICEFPAGLLAAGCAIFGQEFFDNVYQPMGPLTDLFALINSSVNFILYCLMSTQFRVTFYRVVLRCPAPNVPKSK